MIGQLTPSLRVKASADRQLPVEVRRKVLVDFLSDKSGQHGLRGKTSTLFAAFTKAKLVSEDELMGEWGPQLAEAWPRNGWAAAELSLLHQRRGDAAKADEWKAKALEIAKPGTPAGSAIRAKLTPAEK